MTSYVEFHGHGFWCRNAVLREWVRAVLAAAKALPDPPGWLPKACGYWDAIACAAKSGRADLRLHTDITDPVRQRECEALFAAAADRPLPPAVRRAAVLALALVRGELGGAVPTTVDLWADDEWHEPTDRSTPMARRRDDEEDDRPQARRRRDRDEDDDFDDEDDRPRRTRRRDDDEDEPTGWQRYKRSPVRFALLGVLVVVMLVLAYFLYQKKQRERAANAVGPTTGRSVTA